MSRKPSALVMLAGNLLSLALVSSAATRFVNLNNATPGPPYTTWATAATNIQDAVDEAVAGDLILVTNGIYQVGAQVVYGMSNRVAITRPVTVRSINGPAVTHIVGYQVPGTIIGPEAVRCVYLTNGAVLADFTLTNGATQTLGQGSSFEELFGGGALCEGLGAVISNCVLTGNSAFYDGGGAYSGTLNNCLIARNSAIGYSPCGGGVCGATLNSCVLTGNFADEGGGVAYSILNNCLIISNSAWNGGGAYTATLNNCALKENTAYHGGGAYGGTLNNCIITGNSGSWGGGAYSYEPEGPICTLNNCTLTANSTTNAGGGSYAGVLNNCIVYYNSSRSTGANYRVSWLNYCCTTPLPSSGTGNLTNEPSFVNTNGWSDLRLQADSPCINAGNNAWVTTATDLDGNPRVGGLAVDIGAYEFQWERAAILFPDVSFGVSPKGFGFRVSAPPGQTVVIEAATNLASWVPVQTNNSGAAPFYFVDPGWSNFPTRFYRARLQ